METKKSIFRKNSITVKIGVIGVLVLLMLIPVSMIKSMIKEREGNKTAEQTELGLKWGGRQKIMAPVLILPYLSNTGQVQNVYVLPDEFKANGSIKPEERTRGIQKVLSYQSTIHFDGKFGAVDYNKLNVDSSKILWNKAFFQIGISNHCCPIKV